MRLSIVDVFAERRFEGNQLAVVRDAADLDAASMQTIAREMNFSETTFVTAESGASATVRIFTPAEELPFAGHPTLGTARVLAGKNPRYTLSLRAGDVPVRFEDDLAWMRPPPPDVGAGLDPAVAARIVGLAVNDLDFELEARVLHSGAPYYLVALTSVAALRRVRVDRARLDSFGLDGSVFAVARGGYSGGADFAARMFFFDGIGMREDPATGSANSAFAEYLRSRGERGTVVVEQGYQVSRPSRLYLKIDDGIEVGGKVQLVAEGRLL